MRYSGLRVIKEALTGHKGWKPAWRNPEPKAAYDIIIIGGGGHGLGTAYYLAKEHGLTNIAVLDSRSLDIGYRWDTEHPPTRIGLWVTHDGGRSWWLEHVHTELTGTFRFEAETDGVYGFRTHRELGDKAALSASLGNQALILHARDNPEEAMNQS